MSDLNQFAFGSQNIDLRRINPAAIDTPQLQLRTKIERPNGILQHFDRNARIDQRAKKHISADSGEAIEIRNLHEPAPPILVPPL